MKISKLPSLTLIASVAVLLSACGGGGGADQASASANADAQRKSLSSVSGAYGAQFADSPSVQLVKVSETRVSRTVYDYVFTIVFKNGADAMVGGNAVITATGAGTTVIQGAVPLGNVAASATVTPAYTIKLRHDRALPFDTAAIAWSFSTILVEAQASSAAVLKSLEEMVNIESPTGDVQGIAAIADYAKQRLEALGATVTMHPTSNGVAGPIPIGIIKGTGRKKIFLTAHLDTVHPRGTLAQYPFRIVGNRAYGPGVTDDKGGAAAILHALEILKARNYVDFDTVTVLFNVDEETGSAGSGKLIQDTAALSDYALSFETGGGAFTMATSGTGNAKVKFKGLPSHAGLSPEAGVNAWMEAANFISKTLDIDSRALERRFNWTIGGTPNLVRNTIPDAASLEADVRVGKLEDYDFIETTLQDRALNQKLNARSEITVDLVRLRPPYNGGQAARDMATLAGTVLAEVGLRGSISTARSGAGTDIAYAALGGKPTLENMGLSGGGVHVASAEYVDVPSIPNRIYFVTRFLQVLNTQP